MNVLDDLKGKVVVVTGGTGLIGRELCRGFAQCGSHVVIASRGSDMGLELQAELTGSGWSACFQPLDISSQRDVERLLEEVMASFGRIDVWVNSAFPRTAEWLKNVEEVSFESIRENVSLHLDGYFLCTQQAARRMREKGGGSIVNIGSIYGLVGPNFSIYEGTAMTCAPAYPLIKGGIIAMTRYFATYYAKHRVRVNCICPGGIFDNQDPLFVERYENLVPMGRMGTPGDVVGPTIFLASDMSAYMTGQCLAVDGGWTAW